MKIKFLNIALLASSLLALTACEEDPTVINPDQGHPSTMPDASAGSKAVIVSECANESDIIMFNIGSNDNPDLDPSDLGRSDKVKVRLTVPLDHDVTLRVGMDPVYGNYEADENGVVLSSGVALDLRKRTGFWTQECLDNSKGLNEVFDVNGADEAFVTIKAGQTESETLTLEFFRQGMRGESYLFPIQVTEASTGELYAQTYYVVSPFDDMVSKHGERPALFVGYIDTETMSPLISDKFVYTLTKFDYNDFSEEILYQGPFFELINLRTSTLKSDNGKAKLTFTADLEYILKNNFKYISPLQSNGLKVCLCIKGGGTGLGFSNMDDAQIADFVSQVKVTVDMYGLDGVNLWDEGAGYDKEGAAPVAAESYAKLIKSIKTAMPDKLLTLVDTRETTDALTNTVAGISVGDYLDYAWSSLEDVLTPYEPGFDTYKPLAALPENRYGSIFMHDPEMASEEFMFGIEEHPVVSGYVMGTVFTPMTGTDVFVVYDIPYRDYGKEGVWNFGVIWEYVRYPANEDFTIMAMGQMSFPRYMNDYYAFKKDW